MTLFAWELTFTDSTRLVIVQADQTKAEIKAKQLFPNLTLRAVTRLGVFRETNLVSDAATTPTAVSPKVSPQ